MTVSKEYNKHIYEGNGLTVDWPYDFDLPITAAGAPDTSLIHVFRTNLRGEVTEVTAFSVDAETGTLTYPTSGSPLETGEKLTILRLLDVRQQFFDPSNQANLYPETLEDNTDRLVMMVQQLQEENDRAVKVSVSTDLDEEDTTAEGLFEARDIAVAAAATAEGYAAQLPVIADELGVNLVSDEADLRAKLAAIGASNATLVIAKPIPIAADLAIPSNVALSFKRAGQLQPAVGTTLTINGPIEAGLWHIFDGDGTVTGSPKIEYVYPEWFGAVGDDTTNDLDSIQKSLLFGVEKTVIFTNKYAIEITSGSMYADIYAAGLDVPSNICLLGKGSSHIRLNTYTYNTYAILFINAKDNVIIDGMQIIGDRENHVGTSGEWGHGINIVHSTNITVRNCVVKDCWGDGMYVGALYYGSVDRQSEYINIYNCAVYNVRRNGMSIGSGRNITIDGCYIENVRGTYPKAGIDIEPEGVGATSPIMVALTIKNTIINDCGTGIYGAFGGAYIEPILVDITNITTNNCDNGFVGNSFRGTTKGLVTLSSYIITNCANSGMWFKPSASSVLWVVNNPVISNCGSAYPSGSTRYGSGLVIATESTDINQEEPWIQLGNVIVNNLVVRDTVETPTTDRPVYITDADIRAVSCTNIRITVNPEVRARNYSLTVYRCNTSTTSIQYNPSRPIISGYYTHAIAGSPNDIITSGQTTVITCVLSPGVLQGNKRWSVTKTDSAYAVVVTPPATATIRPLSSTPGQSLSTSTIGGHLELMGRDDGDFVITAMNGTWTLV
jgi:hypothetical protein